jgi:hypothetical protein
MGSQRVSVPYPHELSDWADIHAVALLALLEKSKHPLPCQWVPGMYGDGIIWTCSSGTEYRIEKQS